MHLQGDHIDMNFDDVMGTTACTEHGGWVLLASPPWDSKGF